MSDLTFDQIIEQIAKKKDYAEHLINTMKAEIEDYENSHTRMANILNSVAVALKGQEPELSTHSWHDLPKVAAEICQRENTYRNLLLWSLYHHQGGQSDIGQPIRSALGIGQFERLTDEQIKQAKTVAGISA